VDGTPVRLAALVCLLTFAAVCQIWKAPGISADAGDLWWHLRVGVWILQNHAVPGNGLFSQYTSRPWVACSWMFDALAAGVYSLLGLRAIPVLRAGFQVALAAVTFLLAGGRRGNFWAAVLLSGVAQYVIGDLPPLPAVLSMLFFGVELFLLLRRRACGGVRLLIWAPLLFLAWANVDAQFLDGLLLLGLFVAASAAEFLWPLSSAVSFPTPARRLAGVLAAAGLAAAATLLTPYGWRLFPSAFQLVYGKVRLENFPDMTAMAFRQPRHFALVLLVVAAFFALGRRRSRDGFKFGFLAVFALLAFGIQREAWCVALAAVAVIAEAAGSGRAGSETHAAWSDRKWARPLLPAAVLLVLLGALVRVPNAAALMDQAGRVFPVHACDFIRANRLPAPLFNDYSWGGFVLWYLPEYPPAIDGRLNLYGDEINERYFRVTSGTQRLEEDTDFLRARTILLQRHAPMTKALATLPVLQAQFRLVYQDDLAAVFVRQ
jgi:hypothetical protein